MQREAPRRSRRVCCGGGGGRTGTGGVAEVDRRAAAFAGGAAGAEGGVRLGFGQQVRQGGALRGRRLPALGRLVLVLVRVRVRVRGGEGGGLERRAKLDDALAALGGGARGGSDAKRLPVVTLGGGA